MKQNESIKELSRLITEAIYYKMKDIVSEEYNKKELESDSYILSTLKKCGKIARYQEENIPKPWIVMIFPYFTGLYFTGPDVVKALMVGNQKKFNSTEITIEECYDLPIDVSYAHRIAAINFLYYIGVCSLMTYIIRGNYKRFEAQVQSFVMNIFEESEGDKNKFCQLIKEKMLVDISSEKFKKLGLGKFRTFCDYVSGKDSKNQLDNILDNLFVPNDTQSETVSIGL